MLRLPAAAAASVALAACSPTFNWRDVPVAATGLKAALPCKPDSAERKIELRPGEAVVVHAFGCETGDVSFAILSADVKDPAALGPTLAQWRQANLAGLRGTPTTEAAFVPRGAMGLPQSIQLRAQGKRADGSAVDSRTAYFARGTRVFQAAVYSKRIDDAAADTFFAGLRFE